MQVIAAIYETIRDASPGGTPAGVLYAALMQYGCTLSQFESIVEMLVRAGMIERKGDILRATKVEVAT